MQIPSELIGFSEIGGQMDFIPVEPHFLKVENHIALYLEQKGVPRIVPT